MRLAVVTPGFSADDRDWCIPVLVDVIAELSHHVDVHVFAIRYPARTDRYRVRGATVHSLGGGTARGARRLALLRRALGAVVAEHRAGAFDAIHGLWADEAGTIAAVGGRLLGVPSVVSVMGGELVGLHDIRYGGSLSWSTRALTSLSLRTATALTAGCNQAVAELQRAVSIRRRGRIQRLTWGVDPSLFHADGPAERLEGEFRVLQVGSLVPVKDPGLLLRAVARIRGQIPGIHAHFLGDGPLRGGLEAQASRIGLGGAVTFHGHVSREQLGGYYRAAEALAVSSRHEMQPAVALEARLCGLPVVGTAVGLLPELAVAVAPVEDETALGAALIHVARSATTEVPRADLVAGYTASDTVQRLLDLYHGLQGERRAPARSIRQPIVTRSVFDYMPRQGHDGGAARELDESTRAVEGRRQ